MMYGYPSTAAVGHNLCFIQIADMGVKSSLETNGIVK